MKIYSFTSIHVHSRRNSAGTHEYSRLFTPTLKGREWREWLESGKAEGEPLQ